MHASPESNTKPTDSAFALIHATRAFGATRAVDDVSLAFARGRTSILIGSSGSGKSTLLRMLLGLEWPTAGEVLYDGEPLRRETLLDVRRRVGYVIQDGGLFPHLTVLGNLALLARHLGWKPPRVRERARELTRLAWVRLTHWCATACRTNCARSSAASARP